MSIPDAKKTAFCSDSAYPADFYGISMEKERYSDTIYAGILRSAWHFVPKSYHSDCANSDFCSLSFGAKE